MDNNINVEEKDAIKESDAVKESDTVKESVIKGDEVSGVFGPVGIILGLIIGGPFVFLVAMLGNHQIKNGKTTRDLEVVYGILIVVFAILNIFLLVKTLSFLDSFNETSNNYNFSDYNSYE